MKYSTLKEAPFKIIEGIRHVAATSSFLRRNDELTILHGIPACPECKHLLHMNIRTAGWHCIWCNTDWAVLDLIQAIETEDALATVSIRDLEDYNG